MSTDLEELITCQICFEKFDEIYKIPMLLPECQHTVCKICLTKLEHREEVMLKTRILRSKKSVIVCPFCRKEYKLNADEIMKNQTCLKLIRSQLNFPPKEKLNKESKQNFQWNQENYLKGLFNNVDINGDGKITLTELHVALIRGQPNSKFDIKTVKLLVNKHDTNHDGEINFEEFVNLFNFLNEEYCNFLMADTDESQTIDAKELENILITQGYEISEDFFKFIVKTVKLHTDNEISFDLLCRIVARFNFLIDLFDKELYEYSSLKLESYLRDSFFNEFW